MRNLFIAPHCDDETLWGAYIIMNYKCDVVVFVDEKTTQVNKDECIAACKILGVADLKFVTKIEQVDKTYDKIFVPYCEGGHKFHDEVFYSAYGYFNQEKIKCYMSYGKDKTKPPAGRICLPHSPAMEALKLQALACYESQHKSAAVHFNLKNKNEWLFN
jgi:LmbE family N-acetylglucosaminyl deacetylase